MRRLFFVCTLGAAGLLLAARGVAAQRGPHARDPRCGPPAWAGARAGHHGCPHAMKHRWARGDRHHAMRGGDRARPWARRRWARGSWARRAWMFRRYLQRHPGRFARLRRFLRGLRAPAYAWRRFRARKGPQGFRAPGCPCCCAPARGPGRPHMGGPPRGRPQARPGARRQPRREQAHRMSPPRGRAQRGERRMRPRAGMREGMRKYMQRRLRMQRRMQERLRLRLQKKKEPRHGPSRKHEKGEHSRTHRILYLL